MVPAPKPILLPSVDLSTELGQRNTKTRGACVITNGLSPKILVTYSAPCTMVPFTSWRIPRNRQPKRSIEISFKNSIRQSRPPPRTISTVKPASARQAVAIESPKWPASGRDRWHHSATMTSNAVAGRMISKSKSAENIKAR